MFEIRYSENFNSDCFEKIPNNLKKIIKKSIEERLALSPHQVGKPLRGNLIGLWRYRVGDYRIIYKIDHLMVIVLIIKIAHRKDIYR